MSRRARMAKFGTAVAVSAGSLAFLASPAGAWTGTLQASASCVGTVPTVNWTVTESIKGGTITVSDNLGYLVHTSSGVLQLPSGTTSVTVTLHIVWPNNGHPQHSNSSDTINFPGGCIASTTTTSTTSTTSTTVAPTTSTTMPSSSTSSTPPTSMPASTTTTIPHTSPGNTTTTTSTTTTIPDGTTIPGSTTVPVTAQPASVIVSPSPADGGGLAFTGYNAAETAGVGGLLIIGGSVAVWKSRRRYAARHLKNKK